MNAKQTTATVKALVLITLGDLNVHVSKKILYYHRTEDFALHQLLLLCPSPHRHRVRIKLKI